MSNSSLNTRAITVAVLVGLSSLGALAAEEENAPNVILIMADDLGYGDLSCYGSTQMRTPHLDALAEGGVRLTDFYAGATVCTPSRMALLTGAYPPRVGWAGGVLGYKIKTSTGLAPEARTIAEVFGDAGYRTALCGKWHLGSAPELLPMAQGFGSAYYILLSNNQTKKLWREEELIADPFENRLLSEQFTGEAIDVIRAGPYRPFFLYLPYTAPHFPAEAHPDWEGRSELGAYGDVVEELDARIGEIVAVLVEEGIEEETLVVFLSDNGPEPGQKKFATAAPHRGLKWSSMEGGTRVPCILSWPGTLPAGEVRDDLIAAIDLLPTLARAAGITFDREGTAEGSPPIDGFDTWGSLLGRAVSHPRTDLLFWGGWAEPQAIRVGGWKLYFDEVKDVPGSAEAPALFDLASDPAEETDLAADHPERVAEMLEIARARLWSIKAGSIPLGGNLKNNPFLTDHVG